MVANIIASVVLVAIVVSAVRYLIIRHLQAKKTGRPACCGCSSHACTCDSCHPVEK